MTHTELIEKIKTLEIDEMRTDTAEELEFVIEKEEVEALNATLTEFYGPPLKPPGQMPSAEAKQLAAPYGGIRMNQTLFVKTDDAFQHVVLEWPWGDGELITVKIMTKKKDA